MSQVRKHLKIAISLAMAALFALSCSRSGGQTQFSKNMEADANKPAPTYEEWVSLVGQEKADALFAGIGQDSLNVLSYGVGISNMVNFINAVAAPQAMIDLVGNDFTAAVAGQQGPGGKTGLGSLTILSLLKNVDAYAQAPNNVSSNLPGAPGYCGGGPVHTTGPCDIDVVKKLAAIVNMLQSAGTLKTKMVALFGPAGFNLARNVSGANDLLYIQRMAKVVAQVDGETVSANCAAVGRVCALLTALTPAEITGKLSLMIMYKPALGVAYADKLIETIQTISYADITARLQPLITNVTVANITNKLGPILENVTDCTKMGYTVSHIAPVGNVVTVLAPIVNQVADPVKLAGVINGIEDAPTWTTIKTAIGPTNKWVGGQQTWGSPVKAQPYGTAGSGATITVNMAGGRISSFGGLGTGSGYHPDVTITNAWPGCTSAPVLHPVIVEGVITSITIANDGTGSCSTVSGAAITLSDPVTTTGMARLVNMINTITPANYFEMLALIDTVSNAQKLVLLIQDGKDVTDLVQMLNAMTPVDTAGVPLTGCTGVLTITGGGATTDATASGFFTGAGASGPLAYIAVATPGVGYTSQPTVTDAGCGNITAYVTSVISSTNTLTGIYLNALPVNSMAELLENVSPISNITRLREVVDGQRIFDNTGIQQTAASAGTYLYKMVQLISNLNQASEGPIKVTQLINGVTNTDKIIDLIYQVTVTSNLSQIINGIFSQSLPAGCSDAPVSGYGTPGACDLGATTTAGNGFLWGPKNNAVNTLVYVVQNVSTTANLVAMINGTLPAQMKDLINHISVGSQVEDSVSATCATCAGLAAATSTYSAAGMKLVKIIDYPGLNPHDLSWVMNNVSSIIKMAKLITYMPIGQTVSNTPGPFNPGPLTTGTGKVGDLLVKVLSPSGNCWTANNGLVSISVTAPGAGYSAGATVTFTGGGTNAIGVATVNSSGQVSGLNLANDGSGYASGALTINPVNGGAGATGVAVVGSCSSTRGLTQSAGTGPMSNIGKGKIVNMIDYISGSSHTVAMTQLANVINGVRDSQKLGDLINNVQKSSNVVALLNAVLDPYNNNGGSTANLVTLLDQLPAAEVHKLTSLIQQLNPAIETALDTNPQADQDLVAQLMAPYNQQAAYNAAGAGNVTAITLGAPGVVTAAGHTLTVGRQVIFSTTGAATLAAPLNANQLYYVATVPVPGTSFTVTSTPGGGPITTTSAAVLGGGTIVAISSEPTATSGVGQATMNALLGSLPMTNGTAQNGYGGAPLVSFVGGCTTLPTATAVVGTGSVTRVDMTVPALTDPSCAAGSVPSFSAGTAAISAVTAPFANRAPAAASGGNTTVSHRSLYVVDNNANTGYVAFPNITFTGACTNITGNAYINGLSKINLDTQGAGCTSPPAVSIAGGGGATAKALVAGPIATLSNLNPGSGYVAGQTCPLIGAGGTGGTVTITTVGAAGNITAYALGAAGADYIIDQTVSIGGAATAYATVDAAGTITGYTVSNSGCGYTGVVTATIAAGSCSGTAPVPGAVTISAGGQVTAVALGTAGTLCVRNPRVILSAGTSRGDAATLTVGTTTVAGKVIAITMSDAANNLANVLANTEKSPVSTGSINYGSNVPTISAREAMVRLIVHGTTYNGGVFPGVGPAHLAYNVMSVLTGPISVETVINMMNSDSVSLADLNTLIGCGDGVFYGPSTTTDFEAVCRAYMYW